MKSVKVVLAVTLMVFIGSFSALCEDMPGIYGNKVIADFNPEDFRPESERPSHLETDYDVDWSLYEGYQGVSSRQHFPVWSPDGKWIAFSDMFGGGIWLVSADGGTPKRIYHHIQEYDGYFLTSWAFPTGFTPDGKEVIFDASIIDETRGTEITIKLNGSEYTGKSVTNPVLTIMAVDIDTGEARTVMEEAVQGRYSSNGRYFMYMNKDYRYITGEKDFDDEYYGTMILDTETKETTLFSHESPFLQINPADGLAYYFDHANKVMKRAELDGSNVEELNWKGVEKRIGEFHFTENGDYMIFVGGDGPRSKTLDSKSYEVSNISKLFVYDVMANESYALFPLPPAVNASQPKWSPDNEKFCYVRENLDDFSYASEIYVMRFDIDEVISSSYSVGVEQAGPLAFILSTPYPNPFNPATTLEFSLPSMGFTELNVFNTAGQKIRELVSGDMAPGAHSVVWDGRNDSGEMVASGVYISRLKSGVNNATQRMTFVK